MERPSIQLRILGATELSVAGERTGSFVLRQPKRLALLAYLALATAGGFRRRDQIVALFWPELDQAHARTQLRKVLHALRSILGTDAFVTRGEEELRLDPARVWCDAVVFAGLIREENWAEALELYRGDLLEGLFPGGVGEEFETWLGDQRGSLREQAARAAWECSNREDLAGRRAQAVALARRALELDPDDEEAVRRLIAVLDRYGDRAGALQLFREWQSRLQAEYGADPAPETRKLARRVQAPRQGESLETPPALPTVPQISPPEDSPSLRPAATSEDLGQRERSRRLSRKASLGTLAAALTMVVIVGAVHVSRDGFDRQPNDRAGLGTRLAVLPLRSLGDSPDARVGQGLTEELTTALAQLPAISLRSTAQSREALDTGGDPREIGRRLGVALVLDGSVQHGASRSRVTLRLVRVGDGVAVWARAFDIILGSEDLLAARERIAGAVVSELTPRLDSFAHTP